MYPPFPYWKEIAIDSKQHVPQAVEATQSTLNKTISPFPPTIITAEPSASPSQVEEQSQMPAITQKLPSQVDETLESCPKWAYHGWRWSDSDLWIRFRIVLVGKVSTLNLLLVQLCSKWGLVWCREVLTHPRYFQRQGRGCSCHATCSIRCWTRLIDWCCPWSRWRGRYSARVQLTWEPPLYLARQQGFWAWLRKYLGYGGRFHR